MAVLTYASALSYLIGDGVAPLYLSGHQYQEGRISTVEFIEQLKETQTHFKSVVGNIRKRKGIVDEGKGGGFQQFQRLEEIISEGDWGENPALVEKFLKEALSLPEGDEYKRPEWMSKLLSESA